MSRSPITTHILDNQSGRPAQGVPVKLEMQAQDDVWTTLGTGHTDQDGRINNIYNQEVGSYATHGLYRITFNTLSYFQAKGLETFFPEVTITFHVNEDRHYHVPLLLSQYAYTTYRGS